MPKNTDRINLMALSVYQPWPWAIFHALPRKDIENREWTTSYRGWLAIHASKKTITKPYYQEFLDIYSEMGGDISQVPARQDMPLGAIIGVTRVIGCVKRHTSPWFEGTWGWVLEDPIALPKPIAINGQTGLWGVPETERQKLLDQVGEKILAV